MISFSNNAKVVLKLVAVLFALHVAYSVNGAAITQANNTQTIDNQQAKENATAISALVRSLTDAERAALLEMILIALREPQQNVMTSTTTTKAPHVPIWRKVGNACGHILGGVVPILLRGLTDLVVAGIIITMYGEAFGAYTVRYGIDQLETRLKNIKINLDQIRKIKMINPNDFNRKFMDQWI